MHIFISSKNFNGYLKKTLASFTSDMLSTRKTYLPSFLLQKLPVSND